MPSCMACAPASVLVEKGQRGGPQAGPGEAKLASQLKQRQMRISTCIHKHEEAIFIDTLVALCLHAVDLSSSNCWPLRHRQPVPAEVSCN